MKAIGIDPGISNTGIAVMDHSGSGYKLITASVIQTDSEQPEAQRYAHIASEVAGAISENPPDMLTIERVYFNKNVKSACSTAGVIAVCLVESERAGVPSLTVQPQSVKAACGLGKKARKADMVRLANRLFGVELKLKEHHAADAIFVAIAGILKYRQLTLTGK